MDFFDPFHEANEIVTLRPSAASSATPSRWIFLSFRICVLLLPTVTLLGHAMAIQLLSNFRERYLTPTMYAPGETPMRMGIAIPDN